MYDIDRDEYNKHKAQGGAFKDFKGIDIDKLECLFLVYPFAFEGKLIQYIGSIQRSGKVPLIFDYRDSRIDYFEKLFKQPKRC